MSNERRWVAVGLLVAPAGLPPVQVDPLTHDWTFNVAVNTYGRTPKTGETLFVSSLATSGKNPS